jgi:hypothetical protein
MTVTVARLGQMRRGWGARSAEVVDGRALYRIR